MYSNIKKLITKLVVNVRGLSKPSELDLPINEEGISVYVKDAKVFVELDNKKVSYIFIEGNYISNFELLRRIVYKFGIEVEGTDTQNAIKLEIETKKLLKEKN